MENQSVDDLMMCLLGMGFELEDCQDAIQLGKLSVQEVVDWILAGKPRPTPKTAATGGTTLKLGAQKKPGEVNPESVIGSNPFLNPQPLKPVVSEQSCEQPGPSHAEEDKLQTRTMVNDEQRQVKARFEEKQRLEFQKQAKQERVAKKQAKEQALSQIRDDKERRKLLKTNKEGSPSGVLQVSSETLTSPRAGSQGAVLETRASSARADHTASPPQDALIQIRLPDGRAVRERFTPTSVLQEVWQFVVTKFQHAADGGYKLVQPFPHKEFGSAEMELCLTDLGLVPTGSLVLNKVQNVSREDVPSMMLDAPEVEVLAAGGKKKKTSENEPPTAPPAPNPHSWGKGQALVPEGGQPTEGEAQGSEPMESSDGSPAEASDSDEDAGMDIGPPHHLPPGLGGGGLPGFGGGGGLPQNPHVAGAMMQGGAALAGAGGHHAWGEGGQMLIGQMINNDNLPHQQKDPKQLAAEAARQRFKQNPPHDKDMEMDTSGIPQFPTQEIPRLTQLLTQNISQRLCDPRQPLNSLQGIPADVAMHVVNHLIKERHLKPKTLKPFISCHLSRLVLDCYPYVTNELLAGLRYHTSLHHLSLASCPLITDKGLQSIAGLTRLKFLSIAGCKQLTNNCIAVIQELKQLVTLILEDTGVGDEGVCQYAQTSPPELHTLDLSRTQITQQVLTALPAVPHLRVLNLESTQVSSLSGIQRLVQLEGLNVSNTQIVSDALLCLQNHPSLTALNISNTPNVLGDQALQYITGLPLQALNLPSRLKTTDAGMQYLSGMPLHTLDLTNYINVGDTGMEHIGKIHSLKKLRLGNTKVSDTGLLYLEGLKDLEEFQLDRTTVTDTGVSVISGFTRLQELSLSETGISDELFKKEVFHLCVMLSKLNISKTAVTDRGVLRLKLPHLVLLHMDATKVRPDTAERLLYSDNLPQLERVIYTNLYPPARPEDE